MKRYVYFYRATNVKTGEMFDGMCDTELALDSIERLREIKESITKEYGSKKEDVVMESLSFLHEIEK